MDGSSSNRMDGSRSTSSADGSSRTDGSSSSSSRTDVGRSSKNGISSSKTDGGSSTTARVRFGAVEVWNRLDALFAPGVLAPLTDSNGIINWDHGSLGA